MQRRDRQPERQRRLVDADVVDAVDHQGRDAGARLQPLGGEGGAPARALRRDPPPAPVDPAAGGGIVLAIGDRVRASAPRGRGKALKGFAIRRSDRRRQVSGGEAETALSIGASGAESAALYAIAAAGAVPPSSTPDGRKRADAEAD